MTIYILYIAGGFLGGLAIGYAKILQERNTTAQMKGQLASSEVQLRQSDKEILHLREELKDAQQYKTIAETKMEETYRHIEKEKENLDISICVMRYYTIKC